MSRKTWRRATEDTRLAEASHSAGGQQDIPEAFSAAGLIVPDSIARVYCCRQDYQHPIPSRLEPGSLEVAQQCSGSRFVRSLVSLFTRLWRWARPAAVAVRIGRGACDLRRVNACAGVVALARLAVWTMRAQMTRVDARAAGELQATDGRRRWCDRAATVRMRARMRPGWSLGRWKQGRGREVRGERLKAAALGARAR